MGRVRYRYPRTLRGGRRLTAALSPDMELAMLRGYAEHHGTAQGLLDRRMATHATCSSELWWLSFSPIGKQWHRGAVALEMERKKAG